MLSIIIHSVVFYRLLLGIVLITTRKHGCFLALAVAWPSSSWSPEIFGLQRLIRSLVVLLDRRSTFSLQPAVWLPGQEQMGNCCCWHTESPCGSVEETSGLLTAEAKATVPTGETVVEGTCGPDGDDEVRWDNSFLFRKQLLFFCFLLFFCKLVLPCCLIS